MENEIFDLEQAKYELGCLVRLLDEKLGKKEATEVLRDVANWAF